LSARGGFAILRGMQNRRAAWAWVGYDWANSAFALVVITGFFPLVLADLWASDLTPAQRTFWNGIAVSAASLLVALLALPVGVVADRRGWRRRLVMVFTGLGVLGTLALALPGRGSWEWALCAYVAGSLGFYLASFLNDSLLVAVAAPKDRHKLSALAYAAGYLGSVLLFGVCILAVFQPAWFGLPDAATAMRVSFVATAVWWLVFALPYAWWVPEPPPEVSGPARVGDAVAEMVDTVRTAFRHRPVGWFLLAYWCYIDGVHTVITMATTYAKSVGLGNTELLLAIVIVQVTGVPSAFFYGRLASRFGGARMIQIGIVGYLVIVAIAVSVPPVPLVVAGFTLRPFLLVAVLIGLFQGGLQAVSRSHFAGLVPPERAASFFGLFGLTGKFAAILGPVLLGLVARATDSPRLGLASVGLLFIAGAFALAMAERARRAQPSTEAPQ